MTSYHKMTKAELIRQVESLQAQMNRRHPPDERLHTMDKYGKAKPAHEELKPSVEKLRELSSHLQIALEAERTRIAREIHDELGSTLTAIKMELSWLAKVMAKSRKFPAARTAAMIGHVDSAIQTVKKIATDLRPSILDNLGLWAAIEWQAQEFQKRMGIPCTLEMAAPEMEMGQDLSNAIFRIFQETLTNITCHAGATRVTVKAQTCADGVMITVSDNGKGIVPADMVNGKSWGIVGMRERAKCFGGDLNIAGAPGHGTTVILRMPLEKKHE